MSDWAGTATPPSSTATGAYVTVAEVATYFAGDSRATAFLALSSAEQAAYLARATNIIDSLPLRGTRYEEKYIENGAQKDTNSDGLTQTLEFPRYIDGVVCDWDYATQLPVVPADVKGACMEEAIALLAAGSGGGLAALQAQGVQSMSIGGKLSYTFVAGAGGQGLQSAAAKRYMRRYMGAEVR